MRRDLTRLAEGRLDLLVIGGGIHGAGIARDAAQRGLRVGLVERDDFGSGTSGRSTKLIHGGLRYLEQRRIFQVRAALRERAVLLRIAPHLVRPLPFLLPIYADDPHSRAALRAGLWLYDRMGGRDGMPGHQFLDAPDAERVLPGIRMEGLRGAAMYHDAVTDDRRLTVLNLLAAADHGAILANHAEVESIRADQDGLLRVAIADRLHGGALEARARAIVNATGPWADRLAALADPDGAPRLRPSRGAHLALPRLTGETAVLFRSPDDGRVMLAVPWEGLTLIGTTETDDAEDPADVSPTDADIEYLLRGARHLLAGTPIADRDLLFAFAGLRPLLADGARHLSAATREARLVPSRAFGPRLLSVYGGKLTSYRDLARQAVDRIAKVAGMPTTGGCQTGAQPLPGGEVPGGDFLAFLSAAPRTAAARGLDARLVLSLATRHGGRLQAVLELAHAAPELMQRLCNHGPTLRAEVALAADGEMAVTLTDALLGRTGAAFRSCQALHCAPAAAAIMGARLGWDAARQEVEVARYRDRLRLERGARFVP